MATIRKEILIRTDVDRAWSALRDFGALHDRLVPGFVVDTKVDGNERIVTFFNGAVARERLVTIDDDARRIVYTIVESELGFAHHNASARVDAGGPGHVRFTWIADLLPDDVAPIVDNLMQQGTEAAKAALERP